MTFHYYDKTTGILTGASSSSNDNRIVPTAIEGLEVIEGDFDWLSQRVDVATGEVVDYQPPQPSPDHEWDDQGKRWKLSESAMAVMVADTDARAAIKGQEAMSLRAIRELLLDPSNKAAKDVLQEIDDTIAAQRPKISGGSRNG